MTDRGRRTRPADRRRRPARPSPPCRRIRQSHRPGARIRPAPRSASPTADRERSAPASRISRRHPGRRRAFPPHLSWTVTESRESSPCASVYHIRKQDAISIANGIAVVDKDKCIGCGKCTNVCPKNLIQLVEDKRNAIVKCASKDKGTLVKNYCSAGCIGCKICEKKCPNDAIHVIDNVARIDYEKCTLCGLCAEACPKKIIKII